MSDDDNRKRSHQDDIEVAISSKRAALENTDSMPSDKIFVFKLLCPSTITGLVIGKGGANIDNIKSSSGAKVKFSQTGEHFPTTDERIVAMSGTKQQLYRALDLLITKIMEACEKDTNYKGSRNNSNGQSNNRSAGPPFMIRVAVPTNSAGVLIGKGGASIKRMAEESRCKIKMGDDLDPTNILERTVIVISNNVPDLVLGAQAILNQLLTEPKVRDYANTTPSYRSDNNNRNGGSRGDSNGGNNNNMQFRNQTEGNMKMGIDSRQQQYNNNNNQNMAFPNQGQFNSMVMNQGGGYNPTMNPPPNQYAPGVGVAPNVVNNGYQAMQYPQSQIQYGGLAAVNPTNQFTQTQMRQNQQTQQNQYGGNYSNQAFVQQPLQTVGNVASYNPQQQYSAVSNQGAYGVSGVGYGVAPQAQFATPIPVAYVPTGAIQSQQPVGYAQQNAYNPQMQQYGQQQYMKK
eukprot:gene9241-12455_t